MKSLPRLFSLTLLAVSLASCATPSNRRALYFSTKPHGPWTDYERRRQAEAATGVVTGATPVAALSNGPVTPGPKTPVGAATPTTSAPGDVALPPAPEAAAPAPVEPAPDASVLAPPTP